MNDLRSESALAGLSRNAGDEDRLLRDEEMLINKILIVDDDKNILKVIGTFLEQHDYDVLCTPCAKRALEIMCQDSPHLLITDIFMPDMDGLELIQAVRTHTELKNNIPIIAFSGGSCFSGQTYLKEAEQFGADRVFEKPISLHVLLESVRQLLGLCCE